MQKNEEHIIDITGMSHDGVGIGRAEGRAVFVPLSAVGDRVRARIVKVSAKAVYGKLVELLVASPDRTAPACPVFEQCGGCTWRHITYAAELDLKRQRVRDTLRRIAGWEVEPRPILGSAETAGYRNKVQFPVRRGPDGEAQMGFFAPRSHRVVPVGSCAVQNDAANRILKLTAAFLKEHHIEPYDELTGRGLVRHIFVRQAFGTGEVMAALVINGDALPHAGEYVERLRGEVPGIASVLVNHNTEATNVILGPRDTLLWGRAYIVDTLLGRSFKVSLHSFYQINRAQCERLYETARAYAALGPGDTLIDLYCGAGTITLSLAPEGGRAYGVEIVPEAVADARENATRNHMDNVEFLCADAAQAARELLSRGVRPDVVVVDPPRKGCDAALLETVERLAPKRLVYVSCDVATLARDIALLRGRGFAPVEVTPVDMFPRTPHVECVCLLSNLKPDKHIDIESRKG